MPLNATRQKPAGWGRIEIGHFASPVILMFGIQERVKSGVVGYETAGMARLGRHRQPFPGKSKPGHVRAHRIARPTDIERVRTVKPPPLDELPIPFPQPTDDGKDVVREPVFCWIVIADGPFPRRIIGLVAGVIVVHDQFLAARGESLREFAEQVAFRRSPRENAINNRVWAWEHLQRMRRGKDDIIHPAPVDRRKKVIEAEPVHRILKITGGAMARGRFCGPMNAEPQPTSGQPVGIRTVISHSTNSVGSHRFYFAVPVLFSVEM